MDAANGTPTAEPRRFDQEVLIEAKDASFGYGKTAIVEGLNLTLRRGEVVAILGANGAGKTTTLLGLAGELQPLQGEVKWLGSSTKTSLHVRARQGLTFVPEERSVIFGLSVRDNLRLGRGSVEGALDLAPELRPLLRRRSGLLSGGEQQILTLARALSAHPKVLLADELSLGLAPMVVGRLLTAAREAALRDGIGVILVEQHIRQALRFADRAYILRRGRVVLEGDAADLALRIEEIETHYLETVDVDNAPTDGEAS
jgi:branched-chain amino acid transport system ATP-binding protein